MVISFKGTSDLDEAKSSRPIYSSCLSPWNGRVKVHHSQLLMVFAVPHNVEIPQRSLIGSAIGLTLGL